MNLLHQGWGTTGLSADLSIESAHPAAEVWNVLQRILLAAAQPQYLITEVVGAAIVKTQYYLMVHGAERSNAVPHEKARILFHRTGPGENISLGQVANLLTSRFGLQDPSRGLQFSMA